MVDSLQVTYSDLEDAANDLLGKATELSNLSNNMKTKVQSVCDAWKSSASPTYLEDYNTVSSSIDSTVEVVTSLSNSILKYVEDMNAVDEAYAGPKVSSV
ncbi:MAG: WXG100 family type VII secretion target [Lachnospiraceae bacterium]